MFQYVGIVYDNVFVKSYFCFTGNIKTWILKYSYVAEYVVFTVIVYSGKQIQLFHNLIVISQLHHLGSDIYTQATTPTCSRFDLRDCIR